MKKYVVSYKLIIRHIKKSSLSYRTNGNIHMINNRNVNIITDEEGNRIALIKDIRFRGKQNIDWRSVKAYPELIQIALNPKWQENQKEKHNEIAKYGWYRYDVKFAIPIYENNKLVRYNIFGARLLVNHSYNGKKYLYDIVAIKKETSKPHH